LFEAALLSRVHPNLRRCDDVLVGVEWAIATNAEALPRVPGTRLHVAKTVALADVPPLLVYFTIDDEATCTLRGLEVLEPPATADDVYF
jgi:hypothetical protein